MEKKRWEKGGLVVPVAKTNAMRLLEKNKVAYTAFAYDTADGLLDGVSVARKTGKSPEMVFKTLVSQGASKNVHVFCIPAGKELDLKKAARASGEKSITMLPVKDLLRVSGYQKGGCSPLAMKKAYPTVLDASAQALYAVVVSGGRIGTQIELSPVALAQLIGATFADPCF